MTLLTGSRAKEGGKFYWESPSDSENVLTVFVNEAGGLSLGVAEEKAMDSYNETFECCAFLEKQDAIRLRDYLIAAL